MERSEAQPLAATTFRHVKPPSLGNRQQKLLGHLREALGSRHYSRRTEQTYCQWLMRSIYSRNIRHPAEMAEPGVNPLLTHLADGYDIRTVQELLGHKGARTTMVCRYALNRGGRGARSPADDLPE